MTRLRPQLVMELWVLRPYARQFVLLPALGLLLGFVQDSVVPIMVVMALLTGSYGFMITENSHLETLFATLPTSRRTVVLARYLVVGAELLVVGLAGVGMDALVATIRQQPWSPVGSAMVLGGSLAMAGLVLAVQFPFYFALGYARAKLVTWVVVVAVGAVVALAAISTTIDGPFHLDWARTSDAVVAAALIVGGPLLCLAFLAVSASISVRVYARKDL